MPLPSASQQISDPLEQRVNVLEDRMRRHQHTSIDKTTPLGQPQRFDIFLSYQQFSTAGLTQNVTIFNLPAFGELLSAFMYVQTAFAGTTTLTLSVGITGAETTILTAQNSKTTGFKNVIGTDFTTNRAVYSASASTAIVCRGTATIENLDQLSAGRVRITLTYMTPTTH